jgi:hypothetical protein
MNGRKSFRVGPWYSSGSGSGSACGSAGDGVLGRLGLGAEGLAGGGPSKTLRHVKVKGDKGNEIIHNKIQVASLKKSVLANEYLKLNSPETRINSRIIAQQTVPVRLLGIRFQAKKCNREPGPQEPYSDIF